MKKAFFVTIIFFITISLSGCGGGGGSSAPPTFTTDILSDPTLDGDIALSGSSFTVTQDNTQSVFAGIDPAVPGTEYRAFLDFPLTGTGGVPGDAIIVSANLIIFINSIQATTSSVPIRIELVSFSNLGGADFDSTPLASTPLTFPVFQTDLSNFVSVDVTSLMAQAQSLGLLNFQIRLLLDFSASSGRIEINDTTGPNRTSLAPLLQVTYQ